MCGPLTMPIWYSHLTRDTGVAQRGCIYMKNTLKNVVITALLAWVAYLLLDDGTGVMSLNQLGIPVFTMVMGLLVTYMAKAGEAA